MEISSLIAGISMHPIHVEYAPLLGRPLDAYSEQVVETQQHYYEPHYARLLVNPLNHDHSKVQLWEPFISYKYLDLKRLCLN